jgi:peptide/nickel transport system ATP-binding protein
VSGDALVELRDFGLRRGGREVLRQINLTIGPGQSMAVVGRSGAGKSSLLRAIGGLLDADEAPFGGLARVGGDAPWREIGFVFQEPRSALDPLWRAGELVAEPLRASGASGAEREQRVMRALADAGLSEPERMARSFPHQLSGGERQRVLLAVALARRPRLLLLDEPSSALDRGAAERLHDDLERLRREQGLAWIVASHERLAVERAQRVLQLEQGAPVASGDSRDYLRDARDPLALAFAGGSSRARGTRAGEVVLEAVDLHLVRDAGRARELHVLRGASLALRAGRATAVVGASGAGKTSLLRLLLALEAPSAGVVQLRDEDGAGLSWSEMAESRRRPLRKRFGAVFQDPRGSLDPRRSVRETLVEPLRVLGGLARDAADERALRLLSEVGLGSSWLERLPGAMSGGERARVALCRALALDPRILVLDEPTASFDPVLRAEFALLLRDLVERRGLALLFVAHDRALVEMLADEVLELVGGRLRPAGQDSGSP